MSGVSINAATEGGQMRKSRLATKDLIGEGKQVVNVQTAPPPAASPDKDDEIMQSFSLLDSQMTRIAQSVDELRKDFGERLKQLELGQQAMRLEIDSIREHQVNVAEIRNLMRAILSILVAAVTFGLLWKFGVV